MSKYYTSRLGPTDLDQPKDKPEPVLTFDLSLPWPERYHGKRFGPNLIDQSLKAGNYAIAELIDIGIGEQLPVQAARWEEESLQVLTVYGWRTASRLFTLKSLAGFRL